MNLLLLNLSHTFDGRIVLAFAGLGALVLVNVVALLLWIAAVAWGRYQERQRERAFIRQSLGNLDEWKKRMDHEDSVLYRDFKSEAELQRDRVTFPGEVI